MTSEEIRLECLRLAHRHDQQPDEIVMRAKKFETFVSGDTAKAPSARKAKGAAEAAT